MGAFPHQQERELCYGSRYLKSLIHDSGVLTPAFIAEVLLFCQNWIGNNKRKMGMAVKRGPRNETSKIRVTSKLRKRSAYSVFKKEFLASDEGTLMCAIAVHNGLLKVFLKALLQTIMYFYIMIIPTNNYLYIPKQKN